MKSLVKLYAACYGGVLFYLFFMAYNRPRPSLWKHLEPVNILPLKHKLLELTTYSAFSPVDKWNFFSDLFGNIILFVPLPFFLVTILKIEELWKTVFLAWLISLCVEYTQFVFSVGVADTDDIILNTLGACIGAGLIFLYRKYAHKLNLLQLSI